MEGEESSCSPHLGPGMSGPGIVSQQLGSCLSVTDLSYLHMHMCAGERVLPASIVYHDQPKCLHAHNLCNVCTCVSQWCPWASLSVHLA